MNYRIVYFCLLALPCVAFTQDNLLPAFPVEIDVYNFIGKDDLVRSRYDQFIFYEGKRCSLKIVGSFPNGRNSTKTINARDEKWFKDDQASSLLILTGVKGDVLHLYSNPDGEGGSHTQIRVLQDFGRAFCVPTLEQNAANEILEVSYDGNGLLDGEVSYLRNH